jgi:hypothetical protein
MERAERAEAFCEAWRNQYHARFPDHAERSRFFTTLPGPPALAC